MIRLYSAGDARVLAGRLAEVYAERPADPFSPEWLAVPSDGMRRWLNLELARHLGASVPGGGDGIAANIRRAFPRALRDAVLAAGRDDPLRDPWSLERMAWALLEVADGRGIAGAGLGPALEVVRDVPAGSSRYARVRRVADLFDRYHLHRPAMIRAWARGDDRDGVDRPLGDHHSWQPRLWRAVRQTVGEPSPPEALPMLLDRLREGTLTLDLPERLVFFGFSVLPGGEFLEIAGAAADGRDVHVFLLEPWTFDPRRLTGDPAQDPATLVANPLLRSWGRLSLETSMLLAAGAPRVPAPERLEGPVETPAAGTLLGRLQHAIRTGDEFVGTDGVGPSDRSVQFHSCFGPLRQVEVARDALLHLLASDPSLREDDIVVLCPDLDRFRPLIEAGFGPSADEPMSSDPASGRDATTAMPRLRYRIVDRSIRWANPVLGAFGALLELADGRMEAAAVLDFLSLGPVRTRLGLDDEGLALVAEWADSTNLAWGIDPVHRVRFGVPESITTNTWEAALDQLFVGATVQDVDVALGLGGVAPFGVEGSPTEVLGRLAGAMVQLRRLADASTRPAPVTEWVGLLGDAADALLAAERESSWQTDALHELLGDILEDASRAGVASPLEVEYADVRRIADDRIAGIVARPDFFRGGIMCTSLTPLRWLPFRVVCLLGMDQSSFRSTPASGDDLVAAVPRLGDPDPRGETREALLEAVLAAGDHLIVVRDGHDVRTRQPEARSVVAAELFDAALATVVADRRSEAARDLETEHPLHAYDERCLIPGELGQATPWSFDPSALAGASARRNRASSPAPFLASPLASEHRAVIELGDLHDFFAHPAGTFLSRRLDMVLPRDEPAGSDQLPVRLDGLERWGVGARLLDARLEGVDGEAVRVIERARGSLPPGSLEDATFAEIEDTVTALANVATSRGLVRGAPTPFEIDLVLDDGTRLVGVVPLHLAARGPGRARVAFDSLKRKHHLAAWLDLVALSAADPSTEWRSVAIGRSRKKTPYGLIELAPVPAPERLEASRAALSVAVDCFQRGMCEPLPLFPELSYDVYCDPARRAKWRSRTDMPFEGDHPAVRATFGDLTFEELMALSPRASDPPGPGGRVERYAHYLWGTVEATSSVALSCGIDLRQESEEAVG